MSQSLRKALFLDRDGIINEDSGYPYLPQHIRFMPGIFELCRTAIARGYVLVVITNQAGIAKGHFGEPDLLALHSWMNERFAQEGCPIERFYYCPFHEHALDPALRGNLHMRKPQPGMILQAASELALDIGQSLMVGDKPSDRINLQNLRTVIVKSKYTPSDYDVESLEQISALLQSGSPAS